MARMIKGPTRSGTASKRHSPKEASAAKVAHQKRLIAASKSKGKTTLGPASRENLSR